MYLIIEGLKPKYKSLEKALLNSELTRDELEEKLCTLGELCRLIICSTTTYEGLPVMEVMMNVEEDLKFVSGGMTPKEEEERVKFHYDLIKQRDEELKEFASIKYAGQDIQ